MYKLILKNNHKNINKPNNIFFIDDLHKNIFNIIKENNIKQLFICDENSINRDYFKNLNLENVNLNNTNKIFFGINKTIFKTIIKIPLKSWIFIDNSISESNIKLLNLIKVKGIFTENKEIMNKINNNNIILLNNDNNNDKNAKRIINRFIHPLLRRGVKTVKTSRLMKKEQWRDFCKNNFNYLLLQKENNYKNDNCAMVFIEFRNLSSNKFVILNNLKKLGSIKTYILCCQNNRNSFNIFNDNKNVQFIEIILQEDNVNFYNNLLLTKEFWNKFEEENLLICQEDSIIFNSKFKLQDFLEFDYIGAPWPKNQKENKNNVGNGGFSFRKKSKMLEMLEIDNPNKYLNLSENVINYINNANLENPPEDIFFSNLLINTNKGYVADYMTAGKFSTELLQLSNSFGGHNWWLSKNLDNHCFEEDFTRLFDCVGLYSPFKFSLGGGEKYFSYIIKSFIKLNYIIIFFNDTEKDIIYKTLNNFLDSAEIKYIKILNPTFIKKNLKLKYYFEMSNLSFPEHKGIGEINILHTQFPMNYQNIFNFDRFNYLENYNYFILNSEFTKKYFIESIPSNIRNKYNIENKCKIVYPPCDLSEINDIKKIENRFILIGRIFKYDKFANNKYHSLMINIFNKIKLPFELFLVGSCDDMEYLRTLKLRIKNKNIKIEHNISEERKNELLKTSKYIISATGMKDKNKCNQEHFGISLIEGINNSCIPLSFDGGFPGIFLSNEYLFNSELDLFNKINNILSKKLILNPINKEITKKFTCDAFITNYLNIINNG